MGLNMICDLSDCFLKSSSILGSSAERAFSFKLENSNFVIGGDIVTGIFFGEL